MHTFYHPRNWLLFQLFTMQLFNRKICKNLELLIEWLRCNVKYPSMFLWYIYDVALYVYIPSLCYCTMVCILVFNLFLYAWSICNCVLLCYIFVCFIIVVNIMELDAIVVPVRCLASYYTRFNPPFLHRKMPVTIQEYNSVYPFVWCAWAFDFAIWLGTFLFEFSSRFSMFWDLTFYILLSMI